MTNIIGGQEVTITGDEVRVTGTASCGLSSPIFVTINRHPYLVTSSTYNSDGEQPVPHMKALVTGFEPFGGETTNASLEAVRRLPAQFSMSAGTFVCNHAFYGLMHLAAARRNSFRAGFLHVPRLPQQAPDGKAPHMALADIVRGIVVVLEVSADPKAEVGRRKAEGESIF